MKLFKIVFLLIAFLGSQFFFSQEQVRSKKEIENLLANAGSAFFNLDVDKSLKLSKTALDNAYKIKDDALMAKAYNIIGLNFEEFYNPDKGFEYYQKALKHVELAKNDSIRDWVNNNIGSYYSYRKNNFKKSIEYYKKALFFSEKIKDSIEIMYTKLNIASAYFAINDFKNGIGYLERTKDYVLKNNELEAKISLCTMMGSYYSFYNDNTKAEQFFTEAINLSKQNTSELLDSNICDVYNDFSKHYKKNKNYEKAFYYLNLHQQLKEKVYNDERIKKVKLAGSEIELAEYQRQIDKIEVEKSKQSKDLKESKLIVLLFVIILFILLLLLYSLYKNNVFREQSNRELKLTNEELKVAKEKAEIASQLKTQFVSTISHELRTPLYGVVGITNIILDEHKELANSPHLNSLKFSARYLLSLVNDLLQINKIEENKISLENMIFNVSDEIKTIVDSLEFIAVKNNNKLIANIDINIPEFLIGDKLRLSQVFMNLVSNALKFTKDGKVIVTAKQERIEGTKHYIYFSIEDNGVGIAIEDQEKIFEKFVQIERKEGDYQGTGLGLSIVQKLTELFGSKIHLESEEGVGTTFSFTIGFEADETKKNEIINNIVVDLSSNHFYKILVVEDNKINQIVTKKILESNNFKSTILEDGYAAIELLDKENFDVILMDINMPIINGFDTTKLIRKKGVITPIIALTAFDKQEITEQALSSGMNDIIIKPFEQAKLFQVINSLVIKKNID
ncbi:tetratricopeptide repeat-containing hybrid sensor histidine kinase/response regulator [Flavobacterium chungnamense]|uniref:tetratricopeptide repeat-containing hybrid sensor histidine kinase/response regulator n=1 Tax=Flavobacterium chungnamense TaxID=706182 RepID=UPI0031EBB21C